MVSQPGSVTIVECDGDPTKVSEVVLPPADARGMTTAAHGRFLERGIHLVPLTGGDPRQLEPESLAFSPDGTRCYVTLQENNLVAEFDLKAPGLLRYIGLGHTRHAADRTDDGKVSFTEELFAGREPDGIAVTPDGRYLVTADEGDTAPKASKTPKEKPAGGGRTVTVLDARTGAVLGDTGNGLDQAAHRAGVYPDARSDSRGSEPENLVVFEAAGKTWAAVGLERANAVALVDLGDPRRPVVVGACPLGGRSRSPEGIAVLVVDGTVYLYSANEGSGDVTVLRFKP